MGGGRQVRGFLGLMISPRQLPAACLHAPWLRAPVTCHPHHSTTTTSTTAPPGQSVRGVCSFPAAAPSCLLSGNHALAKRDRPARPRARARGTSEQIPTGLPHACGAFVGYPKFRVRSPNKREKYVSTFKFTDDARGDKESPKDCSSLKSCESLYTCPRTPFYRETKGLLHSKSTLESKEYY
jgi:hypothetical protein